MSATVLAEGPAVGRCSARVPGAPCSPTGWRICSVADLAARTRNAIVGGPFGSDLVSKDYVEHGVPVIRGQNMSSQYISGPYVFVSTEKARSLEANNARPGDLVFTQRGTLGQVSIVPEKPHASYLVSQSQMKVTLDPTKADPRFFYYLFSSPEHQENIRQNTVQTGVPHINLGILRAIAVRVPPVAEQRAIAAALSDVDALIGALDKVIKKKRAIKLATAQALLTGRTRLPGFGEASSGTVRTPIGMLPAEWKVRRLGEIGECFIGLTFSPERVVESGMMVLRASNIGEVGLQFEDRLCVDMQIPEKLHLKGGDLLICVRNGSRQLIGKCALVDSRAEGMTFGAFMSVFRSQRNWYVFHVFQSDIMKRQIHEHLGATINQITNKSLTSFHIGLPSDDEQDAIATVLSDMDKEVAALENRRAKTERIKQGMMQVLLTGKVRLV